MASAKLAELEHRAAASAAKALAAISLLATEAVLDVHDAIAAREELTERFVREIEREIDEAKRMLDTLGHPWQRGDRVEYETLRATWSRAFSSRSKDRRAELLRSWKDLRALHDRRLELLRDAAAMEQVSTGERAAVASQASPELHARRAHQR
ncbi:MAG: hypothetical protein HY369_01640 [Candidatus Aenigmarchaeota archaeon]|nr:hypothetical protein [Candidatus Aenigmarchaeota archaeon]